MSAPPHNDTLQAGVSVGSVPTSASRLPAHFSSTIPSASKRICFYRSGDPQFSGHRVVINSRTFKTFDALLDALSKKVPLPFGVRTITTPKGTHHIHSLDELRDGASYVCSDQRRVKPVNLDEVNRRQVPWNTTKPTSAGRHARRGLVRQLAKKSEIGRTTKTEERAVVVWTPKRLVVFKNRDPSFKRTLVLQKRTAPTFKVLLDYLSQVMQFPVLKLYTVNGRRVDGLPALILCSGVVVAAGNEPFRLINYSLQGSSQPSQSALSESVGPTKTQSVAQNKKKQVGSRSRSRNFSSSSERFVVNQINSSMNGSFSEVNCLKTRSTETENSQEEPEEMEACDCMDSIGERDHFIMPSEDDIEKSFRVNQDGSMTVEMKVRLTIKQEEMIHWTTTLSRTCHQRAVRSQPVSGYNSPDSNEATTDRKRYSCDFKEERPPMDKLIGLNEETEGYCGSSISEALEKPKPAFRRVPTPGPRHVRKKEASVENIKRVSQTEVQESMVGAYSYMECTAEGELTEGYRVVSHSSSSSTRPVPKPRKTSTGEVKHKRSHSSLRSSGMAEVLQLQNNGAEITETVMHIYESQGTYANYFANPEFAGDKTFEYRTKFIEHSKPASTDSGPRSSSNDCDFDLNRHSISSDSHNVRKNELLSLSSGQSSPSQKMSSISNPENHARDKPSNKRLDDLETSVDEESTRNNGGKKKGTQKSVKSKTKDPSETTKLETKQKGTVLSSCKDINQSKSPESHSHIGSKKKTVSSAENDKYRQKAKKKVKSDGPPKIQSPNLNSSEEKEFEKDYNQEDASNMQSSNNVNTYDSSLLRDSSVNLCHTDTLKLPYKKKLLDILPLHHPAPLKVLTKQRSMNGCNTKAHEGSRELSESVSMPALHSSQSSVHQYVENWLRKIQPESVPYMDEIDPCQTESKPRVEFYIGSGSAESSEIRSDVEKESTVEEPISSKTATADRPVSHPPVQIKCEGEPVETERLRSFCKSMPSVRIHPAEQDSHMRQHKSSEALLPIQPNTEGQISPIENVDSRTGMKPVLKQLRLSIQSIRRASSHSHLTTVEKERSSSLPDFSSQVASVFGSPSKAFLSFLSVMTLRDGVFNTGNEDANSGSYPEALQVMQSLEKIVSIEDEEELKASLSSLKSSTSSHLKKSWRDFQERNNRGESPPLSPRYSEQEFALEVNSEGEDQDKEHGFGIKELMDELNVPDDLRREISSLVNGEFENSDDSKLANSNCSHLNKTTDITCDNEADIEEGVLDASLQEEKGCSGEQESQDGDISESEQKLEPSTSEEELCTMTTCHPELAQLVTEESGLVNNIQSSDAETSQTDLVKDTSEIVNDIQRTYMGDEKDQNLSTEVTETVANVQTSDEKNTEEETIKEVLSKDWPEMTENASVSKDNEKNYTENDTYEIDEEQVANEKNVYQEDIAYVQSETEDVQAEVHTHTSEIESTDLLRQDSEVKYAQDTESEKEDNKIDSLDECDANKEEQDTDQETSNYTEHPDITSVGSNTQDAHQYSEADEKNNNMEEHVLDENQESEDQNSAFDQKDDFSLDKDDKSDENKQHGQEFQGDDAEPSIGDCESEPHYSHNSEARSKDLEVESPMEECDQNHYIGEEENNANHREDAKSQSSECTTDVGPAEVENYNDSNDMLSEESESEDPCAKPHPSSDQDCEPYNEDKSKKSKESEESSKSQESENEQELQSVMEDKERVPEKYATSEEKDDEADEDEDEQDNPLNSDKNFGSEPCYPIVVDQTSESGDHDKSESCQCQESEVEQAFEEENVTHEVGSSIEDKDEFEMHVNGQSKTLDSDKDSDAKLHQSYMSDSVSNTSVRRESCKNQDTDTLKTETEGTEGQEEAPVSMWPHDLACVHPLDISQDLLDFVNLALLSSALTFAYDTNGHLRIEAERCKIREMSLTKSNTDDQYGQRRLPSPNTSDLSDYRPETSCSCENLSHVSTDLFTESGEEEEKLSIYQSNMKQSFECIKRCTKTLTNGSMKIHSGTETISSPSVKSMNSLASFHDSLGNGATQDLAIYNTAGSFNGDSEQILSEAFCPDSNEGVLIDKGRWLLKENHLIRKSPPVPMGMYENVDTTSADTFQENTSNDVPNAPCGSQQSPLASISSSEMEEMAKPPTPKCMYFNMPHSSDSDPFLDNQSINSSKGSDIRKSRELKVSPMGDTSKKCAKKNGSLPSFASVEFKMSDGKVHPEGGMTSGALVKSTRLQSSISRTAQEEESVEGLNLRCGRHCPIL